MNIQKSEMKMLVTQEIGKQFEAREAAALAEVNRYEGAIVGLQQALEKMESVKAYYNADRDEGKITSEELVVIVKAIDRCRGVVVSLMETSQAQRLVKQGEWVSTKASLDVLEKAFKDEKDKVEGALVALENGSLDRTGRPVNEAVADLAVRRAEARAKHEVKTPKKRKAYPKKD